MRVNKVPVLVTGGAGHIGSHAVLALKEAVGASRGYRAWGILMWDDEYSGHCF